MVRTRIEPGVARTKTYRILGFVPLLVGIAFSSPWSATLAAEAPPTAVKPSADSSNPLHDAAAGGDLDRIRNLLDGGVNVNSTDDAGRTALHKATVGAQVGAVKLLLDRGADVNAKDRDGLTPMELAAQEMGRLWKSGHAIPLSFQEIGEMLTFRGATMGGRKINDTLMHRYAFAYSVEEAKEALDKGANVDGRDERGATPLHIAASAGTVDRMQLFLQYGADVHARDDAGQTPLHKASASGRKDAVQLLLARGADPSAVDRARNTPLHDLAVGFGRDIEMGMRDLKGAPPPGDYSGTAELLLEHGVSPNSKGFGGETPLHWAAVMAFRDVSEALLTHGADINALDDAGETPLHKAASELNRYEKEAVKTGEDRLWPRDIAKRVRFRELITWLRDRGAVDKGGEQPPSKPLLGQQASKTEPCDMDPEGIMEEHFPPLFGARTAEQAERLLASGAELDAMNDMGQTTLHWAVQTNRIEIIRVLVARGAAIERHDRLGRTPLHEAAESGHSQIAASLIEAGAGINATDMSVSTPLHYVVTGRWHWERGKDPTFDHVAVAKLLLDRGAVINAKDSQGKTPLHLAAQYNQTELASVFLSRGADVNGTDESGSTPLHHAGSAERLWEAKGDPRTAEQMASLLVSRGAGVNAPDQLGSTPLHTAAVFGDPEVAMVLLSHGAEINARDTHGETPLKGAERGFADLKQMSSRLPQAEVTQRTQCYEEMIRLLRERGAQ